MAVVRKKFSMAASVVNRIAVDLGCGDFLRRVSCVHIARQKDGSFEDHHFGHHR